jgi:hypothetical protein
MCSPLIWADTWVCPYKKWITDLISQRPLLRVLTAINRLTTNYKPRIFMLGGEADFMGN